MNSYRSASTVALVFCLFVTPAAAQTTNGPAPVGVEIGQRVWVTNLQGLELRGEVVAVSPSFIEVATAVGTKRLTMSDVGSIAKKDSNRNGFLWGTLVGVGASSVVYGTARSLTTSDGSWRPVAAFLILNTLSYSGIGAWIDSRREGREFLYQKPADKLAVRVAPLVEFTGTKRVGIGGSIAWR